jgi:hypothetical protein
MKKLVEKEKIFPVRVCLEWAVPRKNRAQSPAVPAENINQSFRNQSRRLFKRDPFAGERRRRYGQSRGFILMKLTAKNAGTAESQNTDAPCS